MSLPVAPAAKIQGSHYGQATVIPTADGFFRQAQAGDYRRNTDRAGNPGVAGWFCTVSGNPGTWVIDYLAGFGPQPVELAFAHGHFTDGTSYVGETVPINLEGATRFRAVAMGRGGTAGTTGQNSDIYQLNAEYPIIGGPYTNIDLSIYLYACTIVGAGAVLTMAVTKNSGNTNPPATTACGTVSFPTALAEGGTPVLVTATAAVAVAAGDTIGLDISYNNNTTLAILRMFAKVRLRP